MSGYVDCGCRDCFEIAIEPGCMCSQCVEAGCEPNSECCAPGAYGAGYDADEDLAELVEADPDEQCPEHGCAAWRCDAGHT